jgi:CTD small phosphatase-like protein 2
LNNNLIDKKLLVFDLDETLVHCTTDDISNSDKIITVTMNNGEQVKAGVNIRPYAIECLKELAEYYELIVFTASHPYYANVAIDLLDPNHTIFSKRLFRNGYIQTDIDVFIKDLRIFNYDPKTTVIIDNSIV